MKRPTIFTGKILGLMFITFFVFNFGTSHAQQINWIKSYGQSTVLALEKNKLILADFWAIWCVPCLRTDQGVWSNDTISAFTDKFVSVRIDVSNGPQHAEPFYVDHIPTIMILDYRGELLFKAESYSDPNAILDLLSAFPEDVSELYKGLGKYGRDKKDPANLYDLATAYQNCALRSDSPAREIFVKESNKIFKKAKTACKKQKDYPKIDRINLLIPLNQVISDQAEKGIEAVLNQLDEIGEENLSLAYYVLVTGFLAQENQEMATKYYTKLKTSPGGEEYLEQITPLLE